MSGGYLWLLYASFAAKLYKPPNGQHSIGPVQP